MGQFVKSITDASPNFIVCSLMLGIIIQSQIWNTAYYFKPVSLNLALFTDEGYVAKVVILTQPSKGESHVRLKIPPVEAQFDWHLSPFKLSGRHCHCLYFSDLMSHFNTQELECSLVQKIKIAVVFKNQQKGLNFSTTLCHSSGKSRFILRTTNLICTWTWWWSAFQNTQEIKCGCKGLYKSYRNTGTSCIHRC